MMTTEAEIRTVLAGTVLAPRTEEILGVALPAVHLVPDRVEAGSLPPGTSRLGGPPDLPPDVAWPRRNGEPQSFIGQLDLADVAGLAGTDALPPAGWLLFFYSSEEAPWGFRPSDRGSWAVVHVPPGTPLERAEPPADLPQTARFRPCALTFRSTLTLPPWDHRSVDGLGLDDAELELFDRLLDAAGGYDQHRLLGHPAQLQRDMTEQCQLVSRGMNLGDPASWDEARARQLRAGADDWRLLLQVASDPELGTSWADAGLIYYWIREQDLERRDFDAVWLVLQSM